MKKGYALRFAGLALAVLVAVSCYPVPVAVRPAPMLRAIRAVGFGSAPGMLISASTGIPS